MSVALINQFVGHGNDSSILCLASRRDEDAAPAATVWSGSDDGTVRCFDSRAASHSSRRCFLMPGRAAAAALCCVPGTQLVAAGAGRQLVLFDERRPDVVLADHELIAAPADWAHPDDISHLAAATSAADGSQYIAVSDDAGFVSIVAAAPRQQFSYSRRTLSAENNVGCASCFLPVAGGAAPPLLLTGGTDSTVRLWDVGASANRLAEYRMSQPPALQGGTMFLNPPYVNCLRALAAGDSGRPEPLFAVGRGDGAVEVCALLRRDQDDTSSWTIERRHLWTGHRGACGSVDQVAGAPQLVVSGGDDALVSVFVLGRDDVDDNAPSSLDHGHKINDIHLMKQGNQFFVADLSNTLILYSIR